MCWRSWAGPGQSTTTPRRRLWPAFSVRGRSGSEPGWSACASTRWTCWSSARCKAPRRHWPARRSISRSPRTTFTRARAQYADTRPAFPVGDLVVLVGLKDRITAIIDKRIGLTPQVHPAGQGIAGQREQEPAAPGAEAGDELVSHRGDDSLIDGRKRKPSCSSGITDRDPVVDQFLHQPGTDFLQAHSAVHHRNIKLAHPGILTGPLRESPEGILCRVASPFVGTFDKHAG
jgi:hypothetical protein